MFDLLPTAHPRPRVLVVAAAPLILTNLLRLLQSNAYPAIGTASIADGVSMAAADSYDLLLVGLPAETATTFLATVRRRRPGVHAVIVDPDPVRDACTTPGPPGLPTALAH